jgi:hypothetical protein
MFNMIRKDVLHRSASVATMLLIASVFNATTAFAICPGGGYTLDGGTIKDVVPHPTEPDTVFVVQNPEDDSALAVLKSCDAGVTWSPTSLNRVHLGVASLAVDPTQPNRVYVSTNHGNLVSRDGGITFELTDYWYSNLIYGNDGTLYSAAGPYKLPRGSATWVPLTRPPQPINVLRPHPTDSNQLHIGQLYSVDGGVSWQYVRNDGHTADVRYSELDPMRVIATGKPVVLSTDGGVNWSPPAYNEFEYFASTQPEGRFVAFDTDDPSTLWVVTSDCGIFRSTNNGANWSTRMTGITGQAANCPANLAAPQISFFEPSLANGDRYYAVTSDGLFTTADDGESWTSANGVPGPKSDAPAGVFDGDADLEVKLANVPHQFTPPTTLRYRGTIRNNGPDAARSITVSFGGEIVSSTISSCQGIECEITELQAGMVIEFQVERQELGFGGGGTRCTGDIMEIRAQVSAVTDDPIPANNKAIATVRRENKPSLISGCPGEGLLTGGGGSVGVLLLGALAAVSLARRRRFRAVQSRLRYHSFAMGRPIRDYGDR